MRKCANGERSSKVLECVRQAVFRATPLLRSQKKSGGVRQLPDPRIPRLRCHAINASSAPARPSRPRSSAGRLLPVEPVYSAVARSQTSCEASASLSATQGRWRLRRCRREGAVTVRGGRIRGPGRCWGGAGEPLAGKPPAAVS